LRIGNDDSYLKTKEHHHDIADCTELHMRGRPPIYTAELAERVLDELSAGRTLGEICGDNAMPSEVTVRKWVQEDVDGFAARYRRARQAGHAVIPGQVCYSRELADQVTDALASGRTLAEICKEPGMPGTTTVARWVAEDRDGFAGRYRLARQTGHGRTGQIPWTPELEELILDGLMSGRTLTDICRDPDMPNIRSVHNWRTQDREGFAARYKRARDIGCETIADEMMDIADDRSGDWIVRTHKDGTTEAILDPERISRARMRLDARRWRLSKMQPRTYGDRPDLKAEHDSIDPWAELLKSVDGKSRGLPNKVRRVE
jgi:terminase small subunit-like protein